MMHDQQRSQSRKWTIRLVIWAVVLALLVVFVAQNFEHYPVRALFWQQEVRLGWALLIAGALGFGLGWLLPRIRH